MSNDTDGDRSRVRALIAQEVRAAEAEDLAAFLLARIAEDEEVARVEVQRAAGSPRRNGKSKTLRGARECEAKRRVIQYARTITGGLDAAYGGADGKWVIDDQIMRALASVYADHPDYRDEWRP